MQITPFNYKQHLSFGYCFYSSEAGNTHPHTLTHAQGISLKKLKFY